MTGFATRLARFRQLPPEERRALLCLAFLLGIARLGARYAGIPHTRRMTSLLCPRWTLGPERLADLVRVAAQALPGLTLCVPRSIVLEASLIAAGHPAELRIGIAPPAGHNRTEPKLDHRETATSPPPAARRNPLDAHAWVEIAGVAVAEDASRFAPLPLFGTRG